MKVKLVNITSKTLAIWLQRYFGFADAQ